MNNSLTSSLYECRVMHCRLKPKRHKFVYRLFMLNLDLAEIPALAARIPCFSHNRFNLFSFYDADHVDLGSGGGVRENISRFLHEHGYDLPGDAVVRLVTFPRVLGYSFSPISFYYIESASGEPLHAIAEVTNTFREMKLYLIAGPLRTERWHRRVVKNFYVSPFSSLETSFDFNLGLPGEQLRVNIDDYEGGERQLVSSVEGRRRPLNTASLLWCSVKYPLLTVRVITLIHWHALLLWAKRVPFFQKTANPELQTEVLRPHSTLAHRKS